MNARPVTKITSWLKFLGKNFHLVGCATLCAKSEVMLARAHVPAEAHYESVALGHWRVQHLKERRINNTLNLIHCLFPYYIESNSKRSARFMLDIKKKLFPLLTAQKTKKWKSMLKIWSLLATLWSRTLF